MSSSSSSSSSSFASIIDKAYADFQARDAEANTTLFNTTHQSTMSSSFASIIDKAYADFQARDADADADAIAALKHQNTSMRLLIMFQDEIISKLLASNEQKRKTIHKHATTNAASASASASIPLPPRTRTRTRTDFSSITPPTTSAAVWRLTKIE